MIAIFVMAIFTASADHTIFDTACAAFDAAEYERSATLFEQIIRDTADTPALRTNAGIARLRAGETGRAIAHFAQALTLDPGYEPARNALAQARSAAPGDRPPPPVPMWRRIAGFLRLGISHDTFQWLAVAVWLLFWLALTLLTLRPKRSTVGTAIAAAVLLFAVGWAGLDLADPFPYAVAAVDRIPVRYTTNPSEPARFELREGDTVVVDGKRPGWVRVMTTTGDRGWAEAHTIAILADTPGAVAQQGNSE